jgi:purine nucleoside phosphorylase|tara:strand:+ start:1317 stop:1517 length:201 start_codon:yes stop_codon:yes gene_type:complete
MAGDVVDMSERMPHLCIQTKSGASVMPVSLVRDVATGRQSPEALGDEVLMRIVGEWLEFIQGGPKP